MSIEAWIESRRAGKSSVGPGASRVLDVLTAQPRFASYATARQVADEADVDISTVTRTAQSLGYRGWPGLQLEIRDRYLGELTAEEILADHAGDSVDPIAVALRNDSANLALMARTLDVDAVRSLARAIRRSRRTLVIASGSYLAPAVMLAHVGGLSGLDIDYDGVGGTRRAGLITRMRPGDCLVVFNVWLLPRDVLRAARLAKERGLVTGVITDRHSSPLAEVGDHVVVVPSEGPAHFPSLTPAMAVINAVLNEITAADPDGVRVALSEGEEIWSRLDLMEDLPERKRRRPRDGR
ncbi:MurR/RpiR family transcriptional regulator [Tsukamurella sp. 8F]|uniref:MurR/RpiR family transcriptional regulator n=1 Tax=unclassified Tsukamurella TaxID=2633480 RepID=UPI0023B8BD0B|nr:MULTISPECIES: MurR/RpiR family transcriptional regulator [unclassified Tsukamurella]MDF0531899.1 MurR/RpiR family transcriptional regulator [Tsukamurella sp. 8J]MDF0586961.1 MurR/RpiR family transcriptional regulator [Tsukamurella sp. 8F]